MTRARGGPSQAWWKRKNVGLHVRGVSALTSGKNATAAPQGDERPRKPAAQSKNKDMGAALRSVYQKTVEETVPEDLLSLLGKLD